MYHSIGQDKQTNRRNRRFVYSDVTSATIPPENAPKRNFSFLSCTNCQAIIAFETQEEGMILRKNGLVCADYSRDGAAGAILVDFSVGKYRWWFIKWECSWSAAHGDPLQSPAASSHNISPPTPFYSSYTAPSPHFMHTRTFYTAHYPGKHYNAVRLWILYTPPRVWSTSFSRNPSILAPSAPDNPSDHHPRLSFSYRTLCSLVFHKWQPCKLVSMQLVSLLRSDVSRCMSECSIIETN